MSAWTRTTLYSRPFRALQFDTVAMPAAENYHHVLTVICLFSRWCWIIPIEKRSGEEIGAALLHHVFGPFNIYPAILRSDNAKEFIGEVVAYINRRLEIHHITGATYHPQAQGAVERLHRKINSFISTLSEQIGGNDWLDWIPFAVGHFRGMKMAALGGRSPMEVVMGIQPVMPAMMRAGLPVTEVAPSEYIEQLLKYLKETHEKVRAFARSEKEYHEGQSKGTASGETLEVNDLVVMRRAGGDKPHGQTRFVGKTDGEIYVIDQKLGSNTYRLRTLLGDERQTLKSPWDRVHGDRLVKLDLPEFEAGLPSGQLGVEIELDGEWLQGTVTRAAVDGRLEVLFAGADHGRWLDLTKHRYRWTVGAPDDNGDAPAIEGDEA